MTPMPRLRLFPRSIAGRLTLWFLLIALIPSVVLVTVMFFVIRWGIEESVQGRLILLVDARARELKTYVREREREVEILARSPRMVEAMTQDRAAVQEQADPILAEFLKTLGYANAYILSANGTILHAQEPGFSVGSRINEGTLRDTELAAAFERATTTGRTATTPPRLYPTLSSEERAIFVVAPVRSEDNLLGALAVQTAIEEFDAIFQNYEGLGDTGEIYAGTLTEKGDELEIISPLRNDPTGSFRGRALAMGGNVAVTLQNALRQEEGYGIVADYRGVPCVGSWTYLPELGIGLVGKIDVADAYRWIELERWISIGLLVLTGFVVAPIALVVARTLSRPLQQASELAQRVADGDLTADLHHRETGEVGRLIESIRDMTGHLRGLISHIQQSIVTLMSTATEIAATSRQQQHTVDEFGHSTSQVASAVNEISATSTELVRTMGEVNDSASRAAELATIGQQGLNGMHETMTRLADSTSSIGSRLSVISERANNINLVVTTITKVADQTNLLSINAAIEAEKAGESGRGFLVVAREIRRLADQTAVATLDIERIVKEMQHSVTAGVMEMDKFNEQVRRGVGEVETIGSQLGEVINAVQVLLPRFEQVQEGMSAQSQGADQIREAMASLQEGASQTAESLREFNKATDQLRDAVGGLKEDISKFST